MMGTNDYDFVDFVEKCLEWKPEKRIDQEQAFQHPWMKDGINELELNMESQEAQKKESEKPDSKLLPSITSGLGQTMLSASSVFLK